jgi:hypothetical protein
MHSSHTLHTWLIASKIFSPFAFEITVYLYMKLQICFCICVAKPKGPQPGTREYAAEDLRKLISTGEPDDIKVEEDLPPLLQVYETIS